MSLYYVTHKVLLLSLCDLFLLCCVYTHTVIIVLQYRKDIPIVVICIYYYTHLCRCYLNLLYNNGYLCFCAGCAHQQPSDPSVYARPGTSRGGHLRPTLNFNFVSAAACAHRARARFQILLRASPDGHSLRVRDWKSLETRV